MSRTPGKAALRDRLARQLAIAADADRPRRVRTKAARYAAALAEQCGIIPRPRLCAWCRRPRRLERHHWDYDAPLVVTHLCGDCHAVADAITARG